MIDEPPDRIGRIGRVTVFNLQMTSVKSMLHYAGMFLTVVTNNTIQNLMDDIDAPDIYFFSPPALSKRIEAEFHRFAEERGI